MVLDLSIKPPCVMVSGWVQNEKRTRMHTEDQRASSHVHVTLNKTHIHSQLLPQLLTLSKPQDYSGCVNVLLHMQHFIIWYIPGEIS